MATKEVRIRKQTTISLLVLVALLILCVVMFSRFTSSRPGRQDDLAEGEPKRASGDSRLTAGEEVVTESKGKPQAANMAVEPTFESRREVVGPSPAITVEFKNVRFQANEVFESWVESIEQISNPVRREQALAEIRLALQGDDPVLVEAGLLALTATHATEYDRESFRALVLKGTTSTDVNVRVAAVKGITRMGLEPADVNVLVHLSEDSSAEVRKLVPFGLSKAATGPMAGAAQAAALRLLDDSDSDVVASMLASIAAMPWTNRIEEKVLSLLNDPELSETVIATALSPRREKSPQVVNALLGAANSDNAATRRKALGALRDGVPTEYAEVAADALIDRFGGTSSVVARQEMVVAIGRLATDVQLERLKVYLQNPMIGESERKRLLSILERLQR